MLFKQQFGLLDSKELKPDFFRGRASETFQPWARKFKAFCNCKCSGFEDISFITSKIDGETLKMRRDRNVWVIDAYIEEDIGQGFTRPVAAP